VTRCELQILSWGLALQRAPQEKVGSFARQAIAGHSRSAMPVGLLLSRAIRCTPAPLERRNNRTCWTCGTYLVPALPERVARTPAFDTFSSHDTKARQILLESKLGVSLPERPTAPPSITALPAFVKALGWCAAVPRRCRRPRDLLSFALRQAPLPHASALSAADTAC
jgi:hypothetical protein